MKSFNFGLLAEYLTIILYKLRFYQILHHRLRIPTGEIDLVALRGRSLVFIEVKARSSNLDETFCTNSQRQRISRSASIFLAKYPKYKNYNLRFDLVIIKPYKLPRIITNAW